MDEEYQREQLLMGELHDGDFDSFDDAEDYDAGIPDHDYGFFDF